MPFGLTNTPASFQEFMNDTFSEYLDDFIVVYIDNILIYSESLAEHKKHVQLSLKKCCEMKLYTGAASNIQTDDQLQES